MKNRRKCFVVYPPNYEPGAHKYSKVYSWRRAWKLMGKFGEGARMHVKLFERDHKGNISFWSTIDVYVYPTKGNM